MTFIIVTFLIILCYCLYYFYKKQLNFFNDHGIPFLPGWPIFGSMAGLIFRYKHLSEILHEVYYLNPNAKYIGTFNFVTPIIVLRDLELIKSITIKNFDCFQDHKPLFDVSEDALIRGNLFNLTGDVWRETRNLLSPSFTSMRMKGMYELMADCGQSFVNYIEEQTEQSRTMINTKDLFTKYTNDVIATCAFGITVNSLKDPKNDFYVLGKDITKIEGLKMIRFLFIRNFPKIAKMLNIKFVSDRNVKFFKDIISRSVAIRDEKGISRPDMLQLMMNARDKDNKYFKMDIANMTAQVFVFFFGGFDTTSTQICIIAHELAINPDIQKKLQDEIEKVLMETDGNPTYEVINGMNYLDAVFNESVRLHSIATALDRVCTKAFEIPPALPGGKPFLVQPGMNIWIPTSVIHRDPKYYDNPNKFDPGRYYKKKISINDVTNLGFGIGPRSCIGNRFAILEIKIIIFFLLSKFTFKPNAKTCIPLKYSKRNLNVTAEGGFWLSIEAKSKI